MDTIGTGVARTGFVDLLHKTWGLLEAEKLHHRLSVIIPIYNEIDSIDPLMDRLFGTLDRYFSDNPGTFEVIAVNDGSTDGSFQKLKAHALRRSELKVVDFRRNYGQTAAMLAGIEFSRGEVLVSLDADLQNDPEDIPLLLAKLEEGADVVSGWRKDRKDAKWRRNFLSVVANRLISWVSGIKLNDYGCTLKAYRRGAIRGVRLYGEMHRFLPIYAKWMGARVVEIPVRHYPRRFGKSKYGLKRIFKVLLDILVIKFLDRYMTKPIYIFGGFGLFSMALSFVVLSVALYLRLFEGVSLIQTPLPLLAAMAFLVACMSILMGLLAEIVVRTYFESQGRPPFLVRELTNFQDGA
jgi:glycosyltransferase involved in cell wall biosynthesis